jgi:beta-phosphoglucomutase family hydrolase
VKGVLGLPDSVTACLFDLDGVLTDTARLHAAAWKEMFDAFLKARGAPPFDPHADYDEYVDGRPRLDGVRSFLHSRGITLPEGSPDDAAGKETVAGLARRKNDLVLEVMRKQGVKAYPGSVRYVHAARDAGLLRAVVSASANCRDALRAAGIEDLFEHVVDGEVTQREKLAGKPAPDTSLAGARALGVEPAAAAVFEDAIAGVQAGRAGAFGFVVGVDRVGQAEQLQAQGADVVVRDLDELLDAP